MAVLITGGTKGIGLAIANVFSKPGVDIFIAYINDEAPCSASAEIAALARYPQHAIKATSAHPLVARIAG